MPLAHDASGSPLPVCASCSVSVLWVYIISGGKQAVICLNVPCKTLRACRKQVYHGDSATVSSWDAICLYEWIPPPHGTAFDMQYLPAT